MERTLKSNDTDSSTERAPVRLLLLLGLAAAFLVASVPAGAQDANVASAAAAGAEDEPPGVDEEPPGHEVAANAPGHADDGLPANCRLPVEGVFWTAADWIRLTRALATNPALCGEYWISIPPLASPVTNPRPVEPRRIRDFGSRFHAMAEMRLAGLTGWVRWVETNQSRFASVEETWYQAGVEFRRKMAAAGYDVARGETWLLNELNAETRRDTGPYARQNMRALVRGLSEGPPGALPSRGAVEIGINYSHQNLPDVPGYKAELKAWLEDAAFWADMDSYSRWLLREVYPDSRYWGVPGSSREERREHLGDYMFHMVELAGAGPDTVEAARSYLEKAYVPLANAGWVSLGGDGQLPPTLPFSTGHGQTMISPEQMMHFVSEQVFAIRRYAGSHPQGAPQGRLGFSWQPFDRLSLGEPAYTAARDAITARLATAIQYAYREGGASPAGACAPPESGEDWCAGEVSGAAFTEAWSNFDSWE